MKWRYLEAGQEQGPVEESALRDLFSQGKIGQETMVAPEGLSDWRAYGDILGEPFEACSQCGNRFRPDDLVRFGDAWVCAGCKPTFFQKLREGVEEQSAMAYGGFWVRFAAVLIDGIFLSVLFIPLLILIGLEGALQIVTPRGELNTTYFLYNGLSTVIQVIYETFMVGRFGGTLGKLACGLRVVDDRGQRVTYLRAFGRYFAKMLSYMTMLIGFIIAGFDSQKRALHDYICSTRVVFRSRSS
jgi:uncharacterized RDD family membrane protein YckC